MQETMINTEVTYTLQHQGRFYLIEHVPARVCRETGEQYFAPETVEHMQMLIRTQKKPTKVIETPVYEYA
ncbi:MAG: YgiT-type zinc finger protein [Lentisphaerae bacterium]|nr:YgiT-type zinc finger protein [Lentisphaerota bacterium]